ncbi:2TM domain-containing protein [Aphanothece sacrum]|uniref:2TM domain-containing protein n=1 Tax=Aphanothece sacrum FPU1 TaxID=1920663 RepID=A0A401IIT3_APHSA|nr:2TM domain-containing protein [Aphanothece sacrum]GBF81225.1 hypothetical protein AsFPU1_2637 [Aphanothece sacrum FPU1]GBF83425.1 hypothetical protein AsFPU3_0467 [Aphanothece sacrum FPU3]
MSVSDIKIPESYSKEDVQEILHLAIARKSDTEELTRTQLWEIAAELDIDPQSLQVAEKDWLAQKALLIQRVEFNQYRRGILKQKFVNYGIINAFLLLLNFLGSGSLSWSLYILVILGLPLALNSWKTFQTQGEDYEKAFQGWMLKKEVKQSISTLWEKFKKAWQS